MLANEPNSDCHSDSQDIVSSDRFQQRERHHWLGSAIARIRYQLRSHSSTVLGHYKEPTPRSVSGKAAIPRASRLLHDQRDPNGQLMQERRGPAVGKICICPSSLDLEYNNSSARIAMRPYWTRPTLWHSPSSALRDRRVTGDSFRLWT